MSEKMYMITAMSAGMIGVTYNYTKIHLRDKAINRSRDLEDVIKEYSSHRKHVKKDSIFTKKNKEDERFQNTSSVYRREISIVWRSD